MMKLPVRFLKNLNQPTSRLALINANISNCHRPNLTFCVSRQLHLTRICRKSFYPQLENEYFVKFIPQMPPLEASKTSHDVKSVQEFENLLNRNWRGSNASDITAAFETTKSFAIKNNINISDERFDKLIDGLMDHCLQLTDDELFSILKTIEQLPPCASSTSHNFHDVWSCLDDVCTWKMNQWDTKKCYSVAELWHKIRLGRLSDFVRLLIDKGLFRPNTLNKDEFLLICFYVNVLRSVNIPFDFEHALARVIGEFNVDELAVVAMGFFKTKRKIRSVVIIERMLQMLMENCETIHELSLSAILKIIRFSQRYEIAHQIIPLLEKLESQIHRISSQGLIHIILLGSTLQIKHESSVLKCIDKVLPEITTMRLKDIERILLICSMFNIETVFYEKAAEEIKNEHRRRPEFIKHARCLASTLDYLSLRGIYNYELMNEILNEDHIVMTYGKSTKTMGRNVFSLDCCIDIECPDYKLTRLSRTRRYKAVKWLVEYVPEMAYYNKVSLVDRAYLDVEKTLVEFLKDRELIHHDHVLPHYCKADMILCRDKKSGKFVKPFGFENYILGDIKRPIDLENFDWLVVDLVTPNGIVRNAEERLGFMLMKERHLKKIGFRVVLIYAIPFRSLTESERLELIKTKLKNK